MLEIMDSWVLPMNADALRTAQYLMLVMMLLFFPFATFFLGGALSSVYLNLLARRSKDPQRLRLSKAIIDRVAGSKGAGAALGAVPLFSLVLLLTKVLNESHSWAPVFLLSGFLIFVPGLVFIYMYRDRFEVEEILSSVDEEASGSSKLRQMISTFRIENQDAHLRGGVWGVILLLVSIFLIVGSLTLAISPGEWKLVTNPFALILLPAVWVRYFHFLATAFAFSGIGLLFFYFPWRGQTCSPLMAESDANQMARMVILFGAGIATCVGSLFNRSCGCLNC